MRVCSVVGARPQFIKAAQVSRHLRHEVEEILIHTGQHYDDNMSGLHFREGGLAEADVNLDVGSDTHGRQTAKMLERLEPVFEHYDPDLVLTYGDTNSTLAASLVAAKLHIPIAHVEAGMRAGDLRLPEEVNRLVADRVSSLLFCATPVAVDNLAAEGIRDGVIHTGDVMYDSLLEWQRKAPDEIELPDGLQPRNYLLLTLHRARNTDDEFRLRTILDSVVGAGLKVLFPVHPRTRARLDALGMTARFAAMSNVILTEPLCRNDTLSLLRHASLLCTDSGGLQKEAFMLGTRCITFREATEWRETMVGGWNHLVDADEAAIRAALAGEVTAERPDIEAIYGRGDAAERMTRAVIAFLSERG